MRSSGTFIYDVVSCFASAKLSGAHNVWPINTHTRARDQGRKFCAPSAQSTPRAGEIYVRADVQTNLSEFVNARAIDSDVVALFG